MLDLVFIASQAWEAGAEGVRVLRDLSPEQAVFWKQGLRPHSTHTILTGRQQHIAHWTPRAGENKPILTISNDFSLLFTLKYSVKIHYSILWK